MSNIEKQEYKAKLLAVHASLMEGQDLLSEVDKLVERLEGTIDWSDVPAHHPTFAKIKNVPAEHSPTNAELN
ncbi:hypothetical protein NHQ30_008937 [Ciborinia camelliae]|nr:hypothetical protein NHQ30_008937 [Ciborinia camelliae]